MKIKLTEIIEALQEMEKYFYTNTNIIQDDLLQVKKMIEKKEEEILNENV